MRRLRSVLACSSLVPWLVLLGCGGSPRETTHTAPAAPAETPGVSALAEPSATAVADAGAPEAEPGDEPQQEEEATPAPKPGI